MTTNCVHGYEAAEARRLRDQADCLTELLHGDTRYPPGARVLEAGCGVGAQTVALLRGSPEARFVCVDLSAGSLAETKRAVGEAALPAPEFQVADILSLPCGGETFDHVFVSFVLEHLRHPVAAMRKLGRVLKPAGTMTVIEGDHNSAFFQPMSRFAQDAVACQVAL